MDEPAPLTETPGTGAELAAFIPPPSRARDLAFSGVFGAAAFLLPTLFHLVQLGPVFMPMYLPLVTLAFLVRPGYAAATALMVPLLSALLTGMPPFYPPIALLMSLELSAMAGLMAWARGRFPRLPVLGILVPGLLFGRAAFVILGWACARVLDLPARFVAGLSLISGWPGLILMIVFVPSILPVIDRRAR